MHRHKPIEATTKELKSSNNKREWWQKWRINKLGCDNKPSNNWSQELWLRRIKWGSSHNHKQRREIILHRATITISALPHTNRKLIINIKFLRSATFRICETILKNTNSARIINSYIKLPKKCRFKIKVLFSRRKIMMGRIVDHCKEEIIWYWNRIWFLVIKVHQVKVI